MKTSALNLVVFFTLCTSVLMAQSNSFFVGANGGANLSKFKYTEDLSELYPTTNSIFGLNGALEWAKKTLQFIHDKKDISERQRSLLQESAKDKIKRLEE